jgi:hypothetical protein
MKNTPQDYIDDCYRLMESLISVRGIIENHQRAGLLLTGDDIAYIRDFEVVITKDYNESRRQITTKLARLIDILKIYDVRITPSEKITMERVMGAVIQTRLVTLRDIYDGNEDMIKIALQRFMRGGR